MNILEPANRAAIEVLNVIDDPDADIERQSVKIRAASVLVSSARVTIAGAIAGVAIPEAEPLTLAAE